MKLSTRIKWSARAKSTRVNGSNIQFGYEKYFYRFLRPYWIADGDAGYALYQEMKSTVLCLEGETPECDGALEGGLTHSSARAGERLRKCSSTPAKFKIKIKIFKISKSKF